MIKVRWKKERVGTQNRCGFPWRGMGRAARAPGSDTRERRTSRHLTQPPLLTKASFFASELLPLYNNRP